MRPATARSADYRLHVAEPRASYASRPPLVADASVVAAALFGEDARREAIALLHGRTLHAPYLLDHEIASVGLRKLRHDKLPGEIVAAALQAYARLPIERHSVDAAALIVIAELHGLTVYDAAYLYVAEQVKAPLATLDDELAAAARAYLTAEREVREPAR